MNSVAKTSIEDLQSEKEAMEKGAPLNLTDEQVAEVEKILATDEVLVN